jgi:hypothetical protein
MAPVSSPGYTTTPKLADSRVGHGDGDAACTILELLGGRRKKKIWDGSQTSRIRGSR